MSTVALTGASGFVGGHVLRQLQGAGHEVRALTRRPMRPHDGVTWIGGDLADESALAELVAGCDAVIHVAGVLNASNRAGFEAGNVAGTQLLLDAAVNAAVKRFVHTSSLAAREPRLSLYGASKARSEELVRAAPLSSAIVRPPAVYGPGDRETLDLFRMAKRHLVLLPPRGRLSLIHVDDLARLLVAFSDPAAAAELTVEPDDSSGGYTHAEFARLLGDAVGRTVLPLPTPQSLLRIGARIDRLVRGGRAKLTADRVAYFCHPNWVANPALAPAPSLWQPRISAADGIRTTAHWYRAQHWL